MVPIIYSEADKEKRFGISLATISRWENESLSSNISSQELRDFLKTKLPATNLLNKNFENLDPRRGKLNTQEKYKWYYQEWKKEVTSAKREMCSWYYHPEAKAWRNRKYNRRPYVHKKAKERGLELSLKRSKNSEWLLRKREIQQSEEYERASNHERKLIVDRARRKWKKEHKPKTPEQIETDREKKRLAWHRFMEGVRSDPKKLKDHKKRRLIYSKKYNAKKRKTDPAYQLQYRIRSRLHKAVSRVNAPKFYRHDDFIGCTGEELRAHLESQFKHGMRWENYGSKWHIDHIRPISSFDLNNKNEQLKCSHFTNLQPLLAKHNIKKSNKWDGQIEFTAEIL